MLLCPFFISLSYFARIGVLACLLTYVHRFQLIRAKWQWAGVLPSGVIFVVNFARPWMWPGIFLGQRLCWDAVLSILYWCDVFRAKWYPWNGSFSFFFLFHGKRALGNASLVLGNFCLSFRTTWIWPWILFTSWVCWCFRAKWRVGVWARFWLVSNYLIILFNSREVRMRRCFLRLANG